MTCTAEMYRPCADPARLLAMLRLRLESACLPAKRKLRKTTKFSPTAEEETAKAKSKEQIRRLMVDGLPPIAVVRLRALATELLQARQEELFDDRTGRNDPSHAAELVERCRFNDRGLWLPALTCTVTTCGLQTGACCLTNGGCIASQFSGCFQPALWLPGVACGALPCYDSDGDGIPDAWVLANMLMP